MLLKTALVNAHVNRSNGEVNIIMMYKYKTITYKYIKWEEIMLQIKFVLHLEIMYINI